jgi:signal transduction histidine kinase
LTVEDIEKFERVNDAMYRITHQIDNVLDFIKGKPLKFTTQSLQKILDSTMQDLPKYEKIKIETVSTDTEIECDFEAMKIVLINLIVNAMYAIEDEGKITIRSEIKDNQVIIEIEDSGPGISDDKLEEIFEPLFTTKQEGTGLGLASCKSIIKQHGGKISVKNNPTRFIIELPRKMND